MASETRTLLTGGCQCGALRFAVSSPPVRVSICHCRMCQKATGAPFASLADIPHEHFSWTRGKPASFQSSSIAERDFCAACGTPLSYRLIGGPKIEIMTGTFDIAKRTAPHWQPPERTVLLLVSVMLAPSAARLPATSPARRRRQR